MNPLIEEEQLMEWLDIHRRARLDRKLREMKVPFFYGAKGKICTTQAAIDTVLLGTELEKEERIDFTL